MADNLPVQCSDDLDNWEDSLFLVGNTRWSDELNLLGYGLDLSDDLDNWDDGVNTGPIEVAQVATEVIVVPTDQQLQVAQVAAEVIVVPTDQQLQVAQVAVEVIISNSDLTIEESDDLDNWADAHSEDLSAEESELEEDHADDLDNWGDAVELLLSLFVEDSDDLDNWADAIGSQIELTVDESDDLDNWSDDIELLLGLLIDRFDDLDSWDDANLLLLTYFLTFTENLDNWGDYFTTGGEQGIAAYDDLDNWDDIVELISACFSDLSDDLDNWADSILLQLAHLLDLSDDLDNWDDAILLGSPQPITQSDDLDNWDDNISLQLNHLSDFSDDLDNWADSLLIGYGLLLTDQDSYWDDFFTTGGDQGTSVYDDLDNWDDSLRIGYGLLLSDDLDNWLDNLSSTLGTNELFLDLSDVIVLSDYLGIGYGLIIGDKVLKDWEDKLEIVRPLGQPNEDDLDNWGDGIWIGYGLLISDQVVLTEYTGSGFGLIVGDDLDNWDDKYQFWRIDLDLSDSMTLSDGLTGMGYGLLFEETILKPGERDEVDTPWHLKVKPGEQLSMDDAITGMGWGLHVQDYFKVRIDWLDKQLYPLPPPPAEGTIDLQVPIDFLDYGVWARDVGYPDVTNIQRTGFYFDPNNYDGSRTYFFEIVATNSTGITQNVTLTDYPLGTANYSQIPIPANTTEPTRFRVQWNPVGANMAYHLNCDLDAKVYCGRIIVNQIGATKTRLWRPLSDGGEGEAHFYHQQYYWYPTADYAAAAGSGVFLYNDTLFDADTVSYTIEVNQGGAYHDYQVWNCLWDVSTDSMVPGTEFLADAGGFFNPVHATLTSFDIGNPFVNGHTYRHYWKYAYFDLLASGKMFRSCIYQTLIGIRKCEVAWRVSKNDSAVVQTTIPTSRALIEDPGDGAILNYIKNETSGSLYEGSTYAETWIIDDGNLDVGQMTTATNITNSNTHIVPPPEIAVWFSPDYQNDWTPGNRFGSRGIPDSPSKANWSWILVLLGLEAVGQPVPPPILCILEEEPPVAEPDAYGPIVCVLEPEPPKAVADPWVPEAWVWPYDPP